MLKKLFKALNKPKEMTVEKAVSIFKNSNEKFEEFEKFYNENVLDAISDNYFEVNSRQATDNLKLDILKVDHELAERIACELANGTEIIEIKNSKVIRRAYECEDRPIETLDELKELDPQRQVQFTRKFSRFDMPPSETIGALATFFRTNYEMFRGALESLDISPSLYQILGNNRNSMGYWLPKVAEISPFKIPDTTIIKVPLSLLQLGRVFDYMNITPTTFEIINRYCMKVFGLDLEKSYFIKNGVYSSKYDFRNAKVTTPNEVRELGQYLFYIHQQACQMSSLLNNKSIYGAGTTNEWVVREYIESPEKETIYMGLPLNCEYRIFVNFDSKKILASANYWDREVMDARFRENRTPHDVHDVITFNMAVDRLEKTYNDNLDKVKEMVQELLENNVEMEGQWSIDIMQTGDKFYLIDMAVAENSFYYDRVPKELRKPSEEKWLELE